MNSPKNWIIRHALSLFVVAAVFWCVGTLVGKIIMSDFRTKILEGRVHASELQLAIMEQQIDSLNKLMSNRLLEMKLPTYPPPQPYQGMSPWNVVVTGRVVHLPVWITTNLMMTNIFVGDK
jgi:hypothetical protein